MQKKEKGNEMAQPKTYTSVFYVNEYNPKIELKLHTQRALVNEYLRAESRRGSRSLYQENSLLILSVGIM